MYIVQTWGKMSSEMPNAFPPVSQQEQSVDQKYLMQGNRAVEKKALVIRCQAQAKPSAIEIFHVERDIWSHRDH